MLEPLDERAGGQRAVGRLAARRRWGVIVALVVFIVVMVAIPKWAGRSGEEGGKGATTAAEATSTGVTTQGAGR